MSMREQADPDFTPAYAPASGVVATDLGDELILLDPGSGEMFSLNATGRCIWQALDGGVAAAAAAVVEAFDVAPERAEADVRALVDDLLGAGLLVVADPGADA
ncbi:MAG TPA: PqqD family protein [Longimicrobiales bacterium]